MTANTWPPAAQLEPYPFTADDPPTVEDFETAMGVLAYSAEARDALASGLRSAYTPNDRDPLAMARTHLRTMARYLAAPNPPDDEEELPSTTTPDEPEEETA